MAPAATSKPVVIRQVWAFNLGREFRLMRVAVARGFRHASMDTEFPGVVFRSSDGHTARHRPEERYSFLRMNVDSMSLIQLGLTLCDAHGNLPDFGSETCFAWEFNFCDFDVRKDPHAADSIELLRDNGIDFERNRREGIPAWEFARWLFWSGLVCNPGISWVSFHGAYDFAYLVKVLTGRRLPPFLGEFMILLRMLFGGNVFDVKFMGYCENIHGSLERFARLMNVDRSAGRAHQAGSDSLLTCHTFVKMARRHGSLNKFAGVIFGLNEITC